MNTKLHIGILLILLAGGAIFIVFGATSMKELRDYKQVPAVQLLPAVHAGEGDEVIVHMKEPAAFFASSVNHCLCPLPRSVSRQD